MNAPKDTKRRTGILFEAGECLREEVRKLAETLSAHVEDGRPEEWATAARLIGRGELQLPNKLSETLSSARVWRLSDEEMQRLIDYIERCKRAKSRGPI